MKYTNINSFEKHLKDASPSHLSPVYLILSKDRFLLKNGVDLFLKALKHKDSSSFSVISFDSEHLSIGAIQDELLTQSLFSKQKAVWVDLGEKPATSFLKDLQECIDSLSQGTYVLFSAAAINHATGFYKKVEKLGIILEVAEEKSWEKEKNLAAWVVQQLTEDGKTIESHACQQLIKQIGSDQAVLFQEIRKLVCYIGDRKHITLEDVRAICTTINIENAWQLGEALFKRDIAASMRISKALLDEGTPFLTLLRQMRNQFQTDYAICTILDSGGTGQEISQAFPYMKGFILEKHMRTAKEYGRENFRNGLLHIDAMELMAKNGSVDPYFLAELLTIKLTR